MGVNIVLAEFNDILYTHICHLIHTEIYGDVAVRFLQIARSHYDTLPIQTETKTYVYLGAEASAIPAHAYDSWNRRPNCKSF